jgi:hypothetical protein
MPPWKTIRDCLTTTFATLLLMAAVNCDVIVEASQFPLG